MNFKSLFLNEDIIKPSVATKSSLVTPLEASMPKNVSIDPSIRALLLQSLQDNKLAGFDYLKFVAALEEMKEFGGTEESRLKMAFITAKQLGVDKVKLTESAKHYLGVLERDASEFSTKLSEKQSQVIGTNEKRLEEIEKTVGIHQKTIASLSAEIEKLQQEKSVLTATVIEERSKLENKKSSFESTYSSLTNEIQANIQKINQCI